MTAPAPPQPQRHQRLTRKRRRTTSLTQAHGLSHHHRSTAGSLLPAVPSDAVHTPRCTTPEATDIDSTLRLAKLLESLVRSAPQSVHATSARANVRRRTHTCLHVLPAPARMMTMSASPQVEAKRMRLRSAGGASPHAAPSARSPPRPPPLVDSMAPNAQALHHDSDSDEMFSQPYDCKATVTHWSASAASRQWWSAQSLSTACSRFVR